MPQNKIEIKRTRFANGIVSEYSRPTRSSNKALILLSGLPSTPNKPGLLEYYTRRGYWCFLPRLRGTWESSGKFLEESPEEDYKLVISGVQNSFIDSYSGEIINSKIKQIDIIGGSFGGTAAVLLSRLKSVRKAVALAPVIDWSVEGSDEPHEEFTKYLKMGFGMAYRGSTKRLKQLFAGDFYNPVDQTGFDRKKLLLIQSMDDKVVPPISIIDFANQHKLDLKLWKKGGHLGLSDANKGKNRALINKFLNIRG